MRPEELPSLLALDGLTVATLFGWQAAHRLVAVRDNTGQTVLLAQLPAGAGVREVQQALAALSERLSPPSAADDDAPDAPCPAQARELLDALRELGWSQARLARRLEIDPNTVSRWVSSGRVPGYAREYLRALVLVKRMGRLLDDER